MVGRIGNARGLRRKRTAVAAWLAVFASANVVAALLGKQGLQIAIALVTVVTGIAVALLQRREGKAEETDELRALVRLPIREVRDRSAREVGVAPESPQALAEIGQSSGDEYLARDIDAQLDAAVEVAISSPGSSLIVVSGPSKAGKTRSLFEAMQRCVPHGRLVIPRTAESIDELVKPGVLPIDGNRPLILWLDDVETFLRAGPHGMHPGVLDEFDEWNTPVVVLATAGGKGLREAGDDASQFAIPMSELMRHAEEIRLSPKLSPRERESVDQFATRGADKIERDGIGAYMIAAPDLERKLTSGRHEHGSEASPHGQAVAFAAIDWQRSGITEPISREVLEQAYPNYLPDHVDPSSDGFEEGLRWAREPLYSTVALLAGQQEFQAYDHIVTFTEVVSDIEINQTAWSQFLAAASDEQAFALASTAYERGRSAPNSDWPARAEKAVRRAMTSENPGLAMISAFNLGVLLTDSGDLSGAEKAFRIADKRGYAAAAVNLGSMLGERGQLEEAEEALLRGEERGDAASSYNLGNLLRKQGRLDEAEAAYRRAEEETASASFNLGNMLSEQERLDEAEAAYRRALSKGHNGAVVNIANVLRQQRRPEEAEEMLRRAISDNLPHAWFNLGNLLREQERPEEAEDAYRHAEAEGDAEASYNLGTHLREQGKLDEAEAAYGRAESAGSSDASVHLGIMKLNRDDQAGAEAAFRRAAEAGNNLGLFNLGLMLIAKGEREEGEEAVRRSGVKPSPLDDQTGSSKATEQDIRVGDQSGGDHQQDRGD